MLGLTCAAGAAWGASAQTIVNLGGGWQAVIASPNASLTTNWEGDGFLSINKTARFVDIDPFTGSANPISIQFRQIAPDSQTASTIIISQEFLTNLTGVDWAGFRMELTPSAYASFDISGGNAPNNLGPFPSVMQTGPASLLFMGPGSVSGNGGTWQPGNIRINVDLAGSDAPVIFQLKEIPLVPTPGAAALLGAGALCATRRRRD
jgi:hypothetical protein